MSVVEHFFTARYTGHASSIVPNQRETLFEHQTSARRFMVTLFTRSDSAIDNTSETFGASSIPLSQISESSEFAYIRGPHPL